MGAQDACPPHGEALCRAACKAESPGTVRNEERRTCTRRGGYGWKAEERTRNRRETETLSLAKGREGAARERARCGCGEERARHRGANGSAGEKKEAFPALGEDGGRATKPEDWMDSERGMRKSARNESNSHLSGTDLEQAAAHFGTAHPYNGDDERRKAACKKELEAWEYVL